MDKPKVSGLSSKWSKYVAVSTERDKYMAGSLVKVSSGDLLLEVSQGEQAAGQVGDRVRRVQETDPL